jgi:hypothetical protein
MTPPLSSSVLTPPFSVSCRLRLLLLHATATGPWHPSARAEGIPGARAHALYANSESVPHVRYLPAPVRIPSQLYTSAICRPRCVFRVSCTLPLSAGPGAYSESVVHFRYLPAPVRIPSQLYTSAICRPRCVFRVSCTLPLSAGPGAYSESVVHFRYLPAPVRIPSQLYSDFSYLPAPVRTFSTFATPTLESLHSAASGPAQSETIARAWVYRRRARRIVLSPLLLIRLRQSSESARRSIRTKQSGRKCHLDFVDRDRESIGKARARRQRPSGRPHLRELRPVMSDVR